MASLKLRNIDKFYSNFQALKGIDLDVADGEFVVFVGPSGCGKSTLLRTIAGLEGNYSGHMEIGGRDITRAAPSDRGVAMVFQSYALYPHMTVRENMEFGMRVNNVAKAERGERVANAARILQLEPYLDRKPAQLSGGQRQRVAIGRAIVREPQVFLFDEPLSNLDAKLRVQMRIELEGLHKQLGVTMIYVTHDQIEAMTMADKIVVLNNGRIEQIGAPMELYHQPATRFVADFIGSPSMNFLTVAVEPGGKFRYGDALLDAPPSAAIPSGASELTIGVRPEHLDVTAAAATTSRQDGAGTLQGTVTVKETLGSETILYVDTPAGDQLTIKVDGETPIKRGDKVDINIPVDRVHVFDAEGTTLTIREPA